MKKLTFVFRFIIGFSLILTYCFSLIVLGCFYWIFNKRKYYQLQNELERL